MTEEQTPKDAFKAKVKERLSLHPSTWAGEDSGAVVLAILATLKRDDGKPLVLSSDDKDIITLASRPTQDLQAKVVTAIVKKLGGELDADTADLIQRVVSPTAFKMELTKAGVIKDDSKGLKGLLE